MLTQVFNPDNFLFRAVGKFADLLFLSLAWLACSLPVVTIGPATAALYYAAVKSVRRGEGRVGRSFFHSFRENLKTGIPASAIVVAAGLLLCNGMLLTRQMAQADSGWTAFCIAYGVLLLLPAGAACYLFPILSRFTFGVGGLFSASFLLSIRHLPSTVVLVLLNGQGILICARGLRSMLDAYRLSPQAIPYPQYWMPLLIVPAAAALLSSLFLERIFKKYTPPKQPGCPDEANSSPAPWYLR